MAISTRPSDKFAFLFSGSSGSQYVADLKNVLDTLLNWYGYPADQIYVRVPFDPSVLSDPLFSTPGLDIDNITGADAGELKDSLQTSFADFISMAKSLRPDIPAGQLNNTFFYFTGNGRINPNNSRYEILIGTADDLTDTYIDGLWLKNRIYLDDTGLRDNSHIHVLMQQSYGYGFWQDVFNLITDPDLRLTFTAACNSGAVNPSNASGSDFTSYWTKALQLEQRDTTGSGDLIYADQEDTGGAEPANNLLISLFKAYLFANSFTQSSTEPKYEYKLPAGDPADQYLGLPSFWIRDGDEPFPPEPMDYWWESKDIFLTHPDNTDPDEPDDYYHANVQNMVHVRIRNNGTHPVREFYSGTIIFLTGGGGVGDSVVHILNQKIKPGEFYEHVYPYDFTGSEAHRCIKSRASLSIIEAEHLDMNGVNDVAWAVADRSNEAQRNLDKYIIAGKSSTGAQEPVPDAGKGMADEDNPEDAAKPPVDENGNNAQPEGTTESKTTSNLRNFAERRIIIRNVFRKSGKFVIPDPFEDFPVSRYAKIEVLGKIPGKKEKLQKMIEKPFRHFPLEIEPGKSRELIIYAALKSRKRLKGSLKIPFEIYLDAASLKDAILKKYRGKLRNADIPDYLPFAGFTVEISQSEGTTLTGTVFDQKRRPVKGAYIYIVSGDRRQSAIMKTNKSGSYCVRNINPDNYTVRAESKDIKWPSRTVFAGDGKTVRVDFFMKPVKEITGEERILKKKKRLYK